MKTSRSSPGAGRREIRFFAAFFGGMDIWTANSRIVEKIREAGTLFHSEKHLHSYMHCWRHRTPIIYRARRSGSRYGRGADTRRETRGNPAPIALRGVDATRFYPSWARRACTA